VSTQLSSSPVRKHPMNIYTMMLILSALFMFIAVIAMWIEARRYAPDYWQTSGARPAAVSTPAATRVADFERLG